jgi:methylenetetrahydrofolate dehydrogenase (NADP+)/methenyltetrahydrofolate cyclohydrolase
MQRIEGKEVSAAVMERLAKEVDSLKQQGLTPGLEVVIVGNDPASEVYVRNKVLRATELGMHSAKHEMPEDTSQEDLLALIEKLNNDPKVHGILVQSPLPKHLDERAVIDAISPDKDVDCFHPYNVGKLLIGDEDGFLPCTPNGVMEMLKHYNIETSGKHAVIIGRSNIVGKPMTVLLARKGDHANCTVTMCHSRTQNLKEICASADILVAAIGWANYVTEDMVKDGAVVIDVGINRMEDDTKKSGYRLVGDVDYENVAEKCSYITPVPGGVGPMTIAMLLLNTVRACKMQNNIG